MRMIPGCIPCLVQMAITTARMQDSDTRKHLESARAALKILCEADYSRPTPFFSEAILQSVYRIIGDPDPFKAAKSSSNQIALKLAQELARPLISRARNDQERVFLALRAAIAGNISDYAVVPDLKGREEEKIREAFNLEFALLDFEKFYSKLPAARRILYICDNAGEIAFDRLLVEEFARLGKTVTVAVKGGPALNDALMEDAREVGLDKVENVSVISTGQAMMGIDLDKASGEISKAWSGADLIISKGQANFESLAGRNGRLFFLTMIKCKTLESELGLPKGSAIFISGETFNDKFGFAQ